MPIPRLHLRAMCARAIGSLLAPGSNTDWQPLSLRIELRGVAQGNSPKQLVLEEPLENSASPLAHWASASLEGWAYKEFGSVTAWRVTLWEGKNLLSEQTSFLW